jgi:hypothetical protein
MKLHGGAGMPDTRALEWVLAAVAALLAADAIRAVFLPLRRVIGVLLGT